jgi:hypothetical protein
VCVCVCVCVYGGRAHLRAVRLERLDHRRLDVHLRHARVFAPGRNVEQRLSSGVDVVSIQVRCEHRRLGHGRLGHRRLGHGRLSGRRLGRGRRLDLLLVAWELGSVCKRDAQRKGDHGGATAGEHAY